MSWVLESREKDVQEGDIWTKSDGTRGQKMLQKINGKDGEMNDDD